MSYYEISPELLSQMKSFAETNKDPIVMINLLRFREEAEYPADGDYKPCSGREAFYRYVAKSATIREEAGAKLRWRARIVQAPIAPSDEIWDIAVNIEYPNTDAYLSMTATPEYQLARLHRQAALLDSRLIMSVEISDSSADSISSASSQ